MERREEKPPRSLVQAATWMVVPFTHLWRKSSLRKGTQLREMPVGDTYPVTRSHPEPRGRSQPVLHLAVFACRWRLKP